MATLKEFITRFGFEVDDHGLKELEEGIDSVKEGIMHLGEALIGEAVGLYELVNHAAEAGVKLKIMTQESGLAAEKLQELQYRAKLADLGADELNQSMNLLSRTMINAKNGSEEARKHFRQLGITTEELRSGTLTTDKVLNRISDRFHKMKDGPEKTALAMEMFGRSGARMVPMLNALHEELDPVNKSILQMSIITDEQIESAEHFHVAMETLKTAIGAIARIVGFGLIPTATEVINTMKLWIVQNKEMIKTNLTGFVEGMATALKLTLKIANAFITTFMGMAHSIGGVKIATELLLGVFAILSGATILIGLGKIIMGVRALKLEIVQANIAAAAIPLAVGAALVAIFLIAEDISSFFSGKDSFLGDLLNLLPEVGKMFKEIFDPIFDPFITLIHMVTDGVSSWGDIFTQLGAIVLNTLLAPLRIVLSTVGAITGIIGRLSGSTTFKEMSDSLSKASDNFKVGGASPESVTGIQATDAVAARRGGASTKNDIEVNQVFTFPPGTDPAVVGDKISSAVGDGLNDVLRSTQRAGSFGGAY